MKMSADDSNIPIRVDDEGCERLETSRLRAGLMNVKPPGIGIPQGEVTVKSVGLSTEKLANDASLAKHPPKTDCTKPSPIAESSSILETPDSGLPVPQNLSIKKAKSLKRKNAIHYDDLIRDLYGYGDTSTSAAAEPPSDSSNHASSTKRYRPMRRNSFLIHPRHGRGGPFPGITDATDAIEAALHQAQQSEQAGSTGETCDHFPPPQRSTIPVQPHRLMDSTNASASGKGSNEEASDDKPSK